MKLRKLTAVILSISILLIFAACKNNNSTNDISEVSYEDITAEFTSDVLTENTLSYDSDGEITTSVSENLTVTLSETNIVSVKDISELSEAEIVDTYKKAAAKSHSSVTSQHDVRITKINVNGEELGSWFDLVKNIISSFISNNTEDSKGITGGYKNLTESDVASAKIYKSGDNTAIEMIMKNQTDGAKTDAQSGSVGHAIDVVGDIRTVTSELTELGLPIEISSDSTLIYYTDPVVKVIIDEDGKIIKGTWSYTVDIRLSNYKAFGFDVQSSSIVMDNVITVNGGF